MKKNELSHCNYVCGVASSQPLHLYMLVSAIGRIWKELTTK